MSLVQKAARAEHDTRPNHPWTLSQWEAYYRVLFVMGGGFVGAILVIIAMSVLG